MAIRLNAEDHLGFREESLGILALEIRPSPTWMNR